MTADIIATIHLRDLERLLNQLEKNANNLKPALLDIADELLDSVEENFEREGRPPWQDIKEETKKRRGKEGKWPGKILQMDGALAASVTSRVQGDSIFIGSNKEYAMIHQRGGDISHPGTSNGFGKGITIPPHQITIDKRPYIDPTDEEIDRAEVILVDHLLEGV